MHSGREHSTVAVALGIDASIFVRRYACVPSDGVGCLLLVHFLAEFLLQRALLFTVDHVESAAVPFVRGCLFTARSKSLSGFSIRRTNSRGQVYVAQEVSDLRLVLNVASYFPLGLRALYLLDIEVVLVDARLRRVRPIIVVENFLNLTLSSPVVPFSLAL